MAFNILGGGEIDGRLGVNPDFSEYLGRLNYIYTSSDSNGELLFWVVESAAASGGQLMANGLYANPLKVSNASLVTKEDVGLGNVDNTSDLDKPISTATQAELRKIKILALAGL